MASRTEATAFLDFLEECELLVREPAAVSGGWQRLHSMGDRLAEKRRSLENTWADQLTLASGEASKPAGARHFEAALDSVSADHFASRRFISCLKTLADRLPWSAFYSRDSWSAGFVDDIAALHIVGPGAPLRSVDMKLGLFLMAPELYYPLHAHRAEELYLVLGGDISFRAGEGEPWAPIEAGGWRYHRSNEPHEMYAGVRPPLTLYIWTGSIFEPSWYKADPNSPEEPPKYPTM